jgi:peptidoglycan/LPS O-acetylase OafA/YrhL
VDFFFMLSGYVMGYAYEDRWHRMTLRNFFTRRLIRLHPMIIMGMIIGAICFYFSASPTLFPNIAETPVWQLILVMLVGFTLLPLPPSMDIRGWSEMHPLNGPVWTLFFEYLANILYAVGIRHLSNTWLALLVFICGAALIHLGVTSPYGDIIGGWALDSEQLRIGFTRLLYPFLAGLLISRVYRPGEFKFGYIASTLLLIVILVMPRIGDNNTLWWNGLYDGLTVVFLFPLVVMLGASAQGLGSNTLKVSRVLGDISYPLYIIHYPIMYIFMAWVVDNQVPIEAVWPVAVLVVLVSIGVAYACLKLYDLPVRKRLALRFLNNPKN